MRIRARFVLLGLRVAALMTITHFIGGCVTHCIYNEKPDQYIQTISLRDGVTYDLAIIEFDDHGMFWKLEQLEDTLSLIERRNAEAERGVTVIPFVHGWKHDANPGRVNGNLTEFHEVLGNTASRLARSDSGRPDRVIGVYLGWRGATSRLPVFDQLTFWDRRMTAERIAALNMREALLRIMASTRSHPDSKCFVVGHSMGGLIVGKTLSPSLATLMLIGGQDGVAMPTDFVLLLNPALDGLTSWQFVDFLKRTNAQVELRRSDGTRSMATGPLIVSITSEADRATGAAYPFGRTVSSLFTAFRTDHEDPQPSQRYLATHAEGHIDYLISHRAWVENDNVVLERVPEAYNDTPFWIIQVSSEISQDHGDTRNPMLNKLIDQITEMNQLYESGVETWILTKSKE